MMTSSASPTAMGVLEEVIEEGSPLMKCLMNVFAASTFPFCRFLWTRFSEDRSDQRNLRTEWFLEAQMRRGRKANPLPIAGRHLQGLLRCPECQS